MADNDSQLELKKRARRRLVGAVALALLAAIVLPMVMDEEPKPLNQDIQIRIPNQDSGAFTSRIMPVKPGAGETKPAEAPGAEAPPPQAVPEKPAEKTDEKPSDKPVPAPDKPAEKAADKPATRPSDKAALAKAEQARAEAVLSGGAEQWVVQLGAFQNPANVKQLRAKLKSEGYNSYTEALETPGGVKTRVRAGPFPSREAAEKVRDRLKRIGLNGVVAQKQ
jgi:DedD protein